MIIKEMHWQRNNSVEFEYSSERGILQPNAHII